MVRDLGRKLRRATPPAATLGRYRLVSRLGTGGMGEIWLAGVTRGGAECAVVLKTMLPHLAESADFVRMFENEAALAAQLRHPNVLRVFESGHEEGHYFIVMEFVRGRSLAQVGHRLRKRGQSAEFWFVLGVLACVCDGLHYAHTFRRPDGTLVGLVHRDVSPDNIMVSFAGDVKLLDFGVAKATASATGESTRAGTIKGKLAYMAPERITNSTTDPRCDVYSVGVVLYELLTGDRPFRADNELGLIHQVLDGQVRPPREIATWLPQEFENTIMRALARDPAARYATAAELGTALRKCAEEYLPFGRDELARYLGSLFPETRDVEPVAPRPLTSADKKSYVGSSLSDRATQKWTTPATAGTSEPPPPTKETQTINAPVAEKRLVARKAMSKPPAPVRAQRPGPSGAPTSHGTDVLKTPTSTPPAADRRPTAAPKAGQKAPSERPSGTHESAAPVVKSRSRSSKPAAAAVTRRPPPPPKPKPKPKSNPPARELLEPRPSFDVPASSDAPLATPVTPTLASLPDVSASVPPPAPDDHVADGVPKVSFTPKKRPKRKRRPVQYTFSNEAEPEARPPSVRSGVRGLGKRPSGPAPPEEEPPFQAKSRVTPRSAPPRSRAPSSQPGIRTQVGTVSGWGKFRLESPTDEAPPHDSTPVSAPRSWGGSPKLSSDPASRSVPNPPSEPARAHRFRSKGTADVTPISLPTPSPAAWTPTLRRRPTRPVEDLLVQLCARSKLIFGAAVVDTDGFLVDAAVPVGIDEERAGGVIAALQGVGGRVAQDLLGGELRQVHISTESGLIILERFLPEHTMALLVDPEVKMGMLTLEVERVSSEIRTLLPKL